MSRYITTFIIFIAVTVTVFSSKSFIISRCDKWLEISKEANYFIEHSKFKNAAASLKEIKDSFDSDKRVFMMILEHEKCEELSAKVERTLEHIKNKEKNLASAELSDARNMISDLKAAQRFSAENIL